MLIGAVAASEPAAADTHSASLRMRPVKRVSQAAPVDDAVAPAGEDSVAAPPSDEGVAPVPFTDEPADAGVDMHSAAPVMVLHKEDLAAAGRGSIADVSAVLPVAPPPARFSVTGSLIERASVTTPSMVTILTRADLLAAGRTMVGDILQDMPTQANGLNAQTNNGGDGSTRIDLRGLGQARTLTLLNGRRFVPVGTGADSTVDLNAIPLAVIERVEVLKDGASSVYGSDAIGGVVNIITRTDFTGTEASLYTGTAQAGDGFSYDASFITGHKTDSGRGNIIFSAGVQRQDPVFAGDREFSKFDKVFNFFDRTESVGGSTAIPGGRIDSAGIDVDGDGIPDKVNICGASVRFCTSDGMGGFRPFTAPADLYNYQPVNYLYTPSSRFNAYTAGTYKLTDDVQGFFEASFLHRESEQQLAPEPFLSAATISRDSIFNPFGGDVFSYNRRLEEFGPRRTSQSMGTFRVVTGVRGTIPDDIIGAKNWKWELSYNYGRTDATQKDGGHLILSHLQNAIGPSFIDFNGTPRCGTPSAPIFGCVPMNILGPSGSIDPAAVAYSSFTGVATGNNVEQVALASAHGRLAQLPGGGDISLALSADFRRESAEFTPDPLVATGDTTGNILPSVNGSTNAVEAAAELQIVALRDADGRERAELDLSARAVRFDSFGAGVTTGARALLRPLPFVTVRASANSAFRAPTVAELFQGTLETFPSITDPCDHAFDFPTVRDGRLGLASREAECAREGVPPDAQFGTAQQRVLVGGNRNLNAETAKTFSAGAVIEIPSVRGLSVSADYWRTDVSDQIGASDIAVIFARCYDLGITSECDRIHRDPALGGAIDFVDGGFENRNSTSTSGVDVGIDFNRQAGKLGGLHVHAEAQRMINFDVDNTVAVRKAVGNYDLGMYPTMRAYLTASINHPSGASLGFNVKTVGGFLECDENDCNDGLESRDVDAYTKVDVFGSFAFARHTNLAIGVNNVFDRAPALIYSGFAGDSDASTYDFFGRFAYARLTQQF